jgi:hypothetical protein
MPCFHTHWLVALEAISNAPSYIKDGKKFYRKAALAYRDDCLVALKENSFAKAFRDAHGNWEKDIHKNRDTITCFSAYMLGACGPDFWMVPSEPKVGNTVPSFGSVHFDLGHYNRTHRQFELSIAAVGGKKGSDWQAKIHRSYFLGMATHIAADLVVHQLVNVVAGAYNLLEKKWSNEHGADFGLHLWNTHNKVEHFWDSYIRYRYLGDYGPFWPHGDEVARDTDNWFTPLGFPTVDGLAETISEVVPEARREEVWQYLHQDSTRFAIEKPLMFPWLFCDRVLTEDKAEHVKPFIYKIVVDKQIGAYPTASSDENVNALSGKLHKDAIDEAYHFQMRNEAGVLGEFRKLEHFSSNKNLGIDSTSFNYVTFKVCPDVERTKGWTKPFVPNSFYDYGGLKAFVRTAAQAAGKFLQELSSAYDSGDVGELRKLRSFWNLDTGLGLRVRKMASDADLETITNLEFIHVFDELGTGNPNYRRNDSYCSSKDRHAAYPAEQPQLRAFPTYKHEPPFKNIESVEEITHSEYLERIPVENSDHDGGNITTAWTSRIKQENVFKMTQIHRRLTLCFRASIADLRSPRANEKNAHCEQLGLYFRADKGDTLSESAEDETSQWLQEKSKSLDFRTEPIMMNRGLQVFETRILANTEDETADQAASAKRKLARGVWNNVVPYSEHRGHYGRNFAIGTGRELVLHPIKAKVDRLNPVTDLQYYKNLSPTEHVFFTLYPLVRKGSNYWDIFSKEDVASDKLVELKKISGLGTVRIVLLYERKSDKSLHLSEAYIDGLQVPVET